MMAKFLLQRPKGPLRRTVAVERRHPESPLKRVSDKRQAQAHGQKWLAQKAEAQAKRQAAAAAAIVAKLASSPRKRKAADEPQVDMANNNKRTKRAFTEAQEDVLEYINEPSVSEAQEPEHEHAFIASDGADVAAPSEPDCPNAAHVSFWDERAVEVSPDDLLLFPPKKRKCTVEEVDGRPTVVHTRQQPEHKRRVKRARITREAPVTMPTPSVPAISSPQQAQAQPRADPPAPAQAQAQPQPAAATSAVASRTRARTSASNSNSNSHRNQSRASTSTSSSTRTRTSTRARATTSTSTRASNTTSSRASSSTRSSTTTSTSTSTSTRSSNSSSNNASNTSTGPPAYEDLSRQWLPIVEQSPQAGPPPAYPRRSRRQPGRM